jgi:hypothetical protein
MEIEKLFRPSKYFVGFCALLVLVWFGYQAVASARISEEASAAAADIFDWSFPELNASSHADITASKVLKKSETSAVVEVRGKQNLKTTSNTGENTIETADCGATLTFYKRNKMWILGKVELQ